jgi:hypothetical protein
MKSKNIVLFFAVVSIFFACGGDNSNLWPNATGKPGEMLLIVDDNKWSSPVGDSLKEVFRREVYGLPQPEPMFDIIQIPNKAFSKLFETHRNIVRVRISPQNEENYVKVKRNVWSRPQVFFEIKAKNDSAFHSMFSKYKESILDSLVLSDRANYVDGFKKFHADETRRLLRGKGIDLMIPKGFIQKSKKDDFFWISHETTILNQGLLVFFVDYTDTAQFQKDILVQQIDSVLKVNVPSEADSYMQTEKVLGPLYTKYLTNNNFTVELRGLWETRTMGGPYVLTAIPEVQRNRITFIMGFVYAPKLDKRNYMRQLEAIISTIRFVSVPME